MRTVLALLLAAPAFQSDPASTGHDPDGRRADARQLRAWIEEVHPDPHAVHSAAEWDRVLEGALAVAEDELAFHFELRRLVALAADGHTWLGADPELSARLEATRFPLELGLFDGHLHVVAVFEDRLEFLGSEVLGLGGVATEEVLQRGRAYVSADHAEAAPRDLASLLTLGAWLDHVGLLEPGGGLTLEVRTASGERQSATFGTGPRGPGRPRGEFEWVEVRPDEPGAGRALEAELLEDGLVLLARYRRVRDLPGCSLATEIQTLFESVDSQPLERLVLDLRGNGGGDLYLNQPLVHGLLARPHLLEPGRLVALIDAGTYSAAVNFAARLERETHAIFVGEPTGAGPNHAGDAQKRVLPRTAWPLWISTLGWQFSDPRDRRRCIWPDVPTPTTFLDWASGHDRALETALGALPTERDPRPNRNWFRPSQRR